MRKGVSPLIAAVVLIAFTITIAFIIANWGTSFVQSQTEDISSQIQCLNALSTGNPQFYPNQEGGASKIAISVTNLNRKIDLVNIKLSVYYDDSSKNLENIDTGITLAPGDTKTIVQDLAATEKPTSVRVVAGNCPNAPRVAAGIVESLGPAPTTSTSTTSTAGTTSTLDTTTTSIMAAGYPQSGNIVGLWHFDGDALDASGNENDGTLQDGAGYTTGNSGEAVILDGENDYVSIATSQLLDIDGEITVSAWIKWDGAGGVYQSIVGKNGFSSGYWLMLRNDGRIYFEMNYTGGCGAISPAGSAGSNNWHHIVGVRYPNDVLQVYVNGQSAGSDNCAGIPVGINSYTLAVGYNPSWGPYPFSGAIDEVVIWNKALTSAEIEQIYNSEAAATSSSTSTATTSSMTTTTVNGTTTTTSTSSTTSISSTTTSVTTSSTTTTIPSYAEGMVAYYEFENDASDSAGNNDGTLQGGVTFASGKAGQAASFDGVNDYILVPDSSDLDLREAFTISFWGLKKGDGRTILSKDGVGTDTNGAYNVYMGDDLAVRYEINNIASLQTDTGAISLNSWHHVAVAYNSSVSPQMKIYVNGVAEKTGSISQPYLLSTNMLIGRRGYTTLSSFYTGLIDELRIYKRVLSGTEIQQMYNDQN